MAGDKAELRRYWRRQGLPLALTSPVSHLEPWLRARAYEVVLATLPLPGEPDLTPLLERWLTVGRLGLPRTDGAGGMVFVIVDNLSGPWEVKPGGLTEPAAGEVWKPGPRTVVLIPGLAFAPSPGGVVRLGRGGGYFDRWLAEHRDQVTTLGVGYPFQLTDTLPREPHDILLDGYVDSEGFHGLEPIR
jgi:5-formyltetrahydrofolate cyclo-ligase